MDTTFPPRKIQSNVAIVAFFASVMIGSMCQKHSFHIDIELGYLLAAAYYYVYMAPQSNSPYDVGNYSLPLHLFYVGSSYTYSGCRPKNLLK